MEVLNPSQCPIVLEPGMTIGVAATLDQVNFVSEDDLRTKAVDDEDLQKIFTLINTLTDTDLTTEQQMKFRLMFKMNACVFPESKKPHSDPCYQTLHLYE